MNKRLVTLLLALFALNGCAQSTKPEAKAEATPAYALSEIEQKINDDLNNLSSFYFTEYLDEDVVGYVMLDSEDSLRISNDNGFSIFSVHRVGTYSVYERDEFNEDGNYFSDYYDFAGFTGTKSDINLQNAKEALMFFPTIYSTSNYESLEFEYFENAAQTTFNYVHEGNQELEFKGETITVSRLQYYYNPTDYTYGIQLTHSVDGVECTRTFYLTMNDDTLRVE